MSCVHIGSALSPEKLELANKQKFRYTSPRKTKRKQARLARMATSPSPKHRAAAAGNPMTDLTNLMLMAFDPEPIVRSWLARNPGIPGWLVAGLTDDADPAIRAYAKFRLKQLEEENEEHQHDSN